MTAGNRRGGPACGRFAPSQGFRWLYLVQQPDQQSSILSALGFGQLSEPLTFCSPLCVADYCYAVAVTTGAATGTKMPPRSGTGWPR